MLIPSEKLQEWAALVEPGARPYIVQFLNEAEAKVGQEIEAAKECLKAYGFKVYENPEHEYKPL